MIALSFNSAGTYNQHFLYAISDIPQPLSLLDRIAYNKFG